MRCQLHSFVYRVGQSRQTLLPSFSFASFRDGRGRCDHLARSLALPLSLSVLVYRRCLELRPEQEPVLVNWTETKGSGSSDPHTQLRVGVTTKRSIFSPHPNLSNTQTHTHAVNNYASERMYCKYLQLSRHCGEQNMADQAVLATHDRPQPSPLPLLLIKRNQIWPNNVTLFIICALWLTLWQMGRSPHRGRFLRVRQTLCF